jgi:putative ABC transport system permease protein
MFRLTVRYALLMLWRERLRFLPAVLAVGFSALLVILQFAVLLGIMSLISVPLDCCRADLFVASRGALSLDLGYPIPEDWVSRLLLDPQVADVEPYLYSFEYCRNQTGGALACCVVGARLEETSLGAVTGLTPELRLRLMEPMTVVIDESELGRLGLTRGVGQTVDIGGKRVRVAGLLRGYKSIGGPYVFCSLPTARSVMSLFALPSNANRTSFLVARCRDPEQAARTARRLRDEYPGMEVFTRQEFSTRTRLHWIRETRTGMAMLFTSALGLLVGLVVTSQTLYAATVASLREYALLRAVGIPRWRIARLILAQAAAVGIAGVAVGLPLSLILGVLIDSTGGRVLLPIELLAIGVGVTLATACLSGLFSLRALRLFEPITLLR